MRRYGSLFNINPSDKNDIETETLKLFVILTN